MSMKLDSRPADNALEALVDKSAADHRIEH